MKWYAVQDNTYDSWDYGSFDYEEACDMLKKQGHGLIAVINDDTKYCETEIYYDELF